MKHTTSALGVALALFAVAPLSAQTLTTWDAPARVTASVGSLLKLGGCDGCPDSGAHSATQLTGDGYAEFQSDANSRIMAGLGADLSAATDASTIDFAFSLWPGGSWEIRERGVYRAEGTYAAGDRFRVSVESGLIVYRRNGVAVYRSAVPPSYPLVLDVTLFSAGATLSEATVVVTTTVPVPVPPPPTVVPPGPPVITKTGPYEAATDRFPHAKPPLPALGPAGSRVTDPMFMSLITRVTDGATRPAAPGRSYRTPSSPHQNAWSANGTRFYVVSGDGSVLPYLFDAATGTAQRINPAASGAGGLVLSFYIEPQFSYLRDSVIFGSYSGPGGMPRTIDQYDFATATYSRLLALDTLVPGLADTYVGGVSSSAGPTERVMAIFGGSRQDLHHYLVVFDAANPSNRQLLDTSASTIDGLAAGATLNFLLHHAILDRSGRYVMLYPTAADQAGPRKAPQSVLWDMQSNVFTEMPVSALPYGHDAFGYGVSVNQDCCTTSTYDAAQWQFRSLAAPLVTRDIIKTVVLPKEVSLADHSTWNNARADALLPFVSGLYRYGTNTTEWRAWDDEIIAVQTDAAAGADATVWRFAHHRSDVSYDSDATRTGFWYQPRPNVSADGRWTLFTSNWEKTLGADPAAEPGVGARQDVFVVALKPSASLTPAVTIGSTPLAVGRVTVPYAAALQAAGGRGTYTWAVTSGALPTGLVLDGATGTVAGTPLAVGTFIATVAVADATDPSNRASAPVTIAIGATPIRITTTAMPSGRVANAYSATLQASGGGGVATWAITGGALAAGLKLAATTGAVSGTPATAGTYVVSMTATDSSDATNVATAGYVVTISAAIKITSPKTLPAAQKGVPYAYTVLTTNAEGTVRWDLAGGTMPPGITLNATTGVISGTCLTAGRWSFNVRVKDSSTTDTLTLTLQVK